MERYILVIEGGTDIVLDGPYDLEEERVRAAKAIMASSRQDLSVFRATLDDSGLSVGCFTKQEMDG